MTRDSDFKKLVRRRMAATGQSYTAARVAIYQSATATAVDLPLTRRVSGSRLRMRRRLTAARPRARSVPASICSARWCPGAVRPSSSWRTAPGSSCAQLNPRRLWLTPLRECDSIVELVAAERAGDQLLVRVAAGAEESLTTEGSPAVLAVSRVEAAQSESYLIAAAVAPERYLRLLEPFLATRWVYGGAEAPRAPQATLSAASFADESRYRRLKITGADLDLSQWARFLDRRPDRNRGRAATPDNPGPATWPVHQDRQRSPAEFRGRLGSSQTQ